MAQALVADRIWQPLDLTKEGWVPESVAQDLNGGDAAQLTAEGRMLHAYQAGDEHALDELVVLHQSSAFWVAYQVVRDEEAARDVVQEAFLRLFRRPAAYDPTRPFKAWFLRVVRNLGVDWLRRQRSFANSAMMEQQSATAAADHLEAAETGERVRLILGLLPEKYRSLLMMRDVEGLEPMAMAEAEGIEAGAMRFRIHYARKVFRKLWIEHFGEEVPDVG